MTKAETLAARQGWDAAIKWAWLEHGAWPGGYPSSAARNKAFPLPPVERVREEEVRAVLERAFAAGETLGRALCIRGSHILTAESQAECMANNVELILAELRDLFARPTETVEEG